MFLSHDVQLALAAGQEGGHHPRFSKELLGSVLIPDAVIANSESTAAQVRETAANIRRSLNGMRGLTSTIEVQMAAHTSPR
jgi:hypothetical protein